MSSGGVLVFWIGLCHLFSCLVDLFTVRQRTDVQKDIQILLLRQQVRVLQRKARQPKRFSRLEKTLLVVLVVKLRQRSSDFRAQVQPVLIFNPETVLRWHRELVRRKWTFRRQAAAGRPRILPQLEALVLQLACENAGWGYDRTEGELVKLGYTVDRSSIRNLLKRHHRLPAPKRRWKSTWRTFLRHYQHQMLACDFFTVETLRLKTVYVLFFIELGTRRVHLASCTEHPTSTWVTQQARQLVWHLDDKAQTSVRFLIHDRDSKFAGNFDQVFVSEGIEIVRTPLRAQKANAVAERWVRTVRQECLDQLLIFNQRHLVRVLNEYADYYNTARPHQGLDQQTPIPLSRSRRRSIRCRDVLGGILRVLP